MDSEDEDDGEVNRDDQDTREVGNTTEIDNSKLTVHM